MSLTAAKICGSGRQPRRGLDSAVPIPVPASCPCGASCLCSERDSEATSTCSSWMRDTEGRASGQVGQVAVSSSEQGPPGVWVTGSVYAAHPEDAKPLPPGVPEGSPAGSGAHRPNQWTCWGQTHQGGDPTQQFIHGEFGRAQHKVL